jgi:hypothetical protein
MPLPYHLPFSRVDGCKAAIRRPNAQIAVQRHQVNRIAGPALSLVILLRNRPSSVDAVRWLLKISLKRGAHDHLFIVDQAPENVTPNAPATRINSSTP